MNIRKNDIPPDGYNNEILKTLTEFDNFGASLGYVPALRIADIVGVIGDIKPATLIYMPDIITDKESCDKLQRFMDRLGIIQQHVPDGDISIFSKCGGTATQLSKVISPRYTEGKILSDEEERKIGSLLGYPKTATDYYLWRLRQMQLYGDNVDLPDPISVTDNRRFFDGLVLSPDNYADELEAYVTPLASAVRDLTPLTYSNIVKLGKANEALEERATRFKRYGFLGRLAARILGF